MEIIMKYFDDLVGTRDADVDGVGPWYWLKQDTGAWVGPKSDFESEHKYKWFKHVKDFDVCVQAGACQGMYPLLLSRTFGAVYSFEPDRTNFYVASLNCQVENVFLFNCALGSGGFVKVMKRYPDNVGMNQVEPDGMVPALRLDSFELPKLGLLALDIEGYEIHALRGALATLERCSPVVVCEAPSAEVRELLQALNYVQEEQSVSDAVFVRT